MESSKSSSGLLQEIHHFMEMHKADLFFWKKVVTQYQLNIELQETQRWVQYLIGKQEFSALRQQVKTYYRNDRSIKLHLRKIFSYLFSIFSIDQVKSQLIFFNKFQHIITNYKILNTFSRSYYLSYTMEQNTTKIVPQNSEVKNQSPSEIKNVYEQLKDFYQEIIDKTNDEKEKLLDYTDYLGLDQNTRYFVQLVNTNLEKMVDGDLAYKVKQEIDKKNKRYSIDTVVMSKIVKETRQEMFNIIKFVSKIKDIKNRGAFIQELKQEFLKDLKGNIIMHGEQQCTLEQWKQKGKPLSQIDGLNLRSQNLQEIPVQLRLFTNIKKLDLSKNEIVEIQHLLKCTNLEELNLNQNKIHKLQGLQNLTNLHTFSIGHNQISSLEGTESFKHLKKLIIHNNNINKLDGLNSFSQLAQVSLYSNPLLQNQDEKNKIKTMEANNIIVKSKN